MAVERFPVEAGHVLMFARSIGDQNPVYRDAEYAVSTEVGGVPAPPTFVQGSAQFDEDYPLRWSPDRPWNGSGKQATSAPPRTSAGSGAGSRARSGQVGLHAEQHYEYHRPLVVGDVLTATTRPGEPWEKQGRSGRLLFSEAITEYRDLDGELVVTARTVGVVAEAPTRDVA
ncbi:MAG: MaoC family dehydratase N-terminal domain-containing protein [Acidimicrobiia bacterium]